MDSVVGSRRHVLLVGIPPDRRSDLASELANGGSTVGTVETGGDCLDALSAEPPDAVVIGDAETVDCIALLEDVHAAAPDLPVILHPAHGSERLAARALAAGASGYVPASDGPEVLVDALVTEFARQPPAGDVDLERRYRELVEAAPVPINLFDADGDIVWSNDALADLLAAESAAALVGRSIFEFIADADTETAREELGRVVGEAAHTGPTAFRVETTDGQTRHVQVATTPATVGDERVAQAVVVDVTQRQQVVEALRDQRRFMANTLDTLRDVFYLVSPEGTLERWNDRLNEVTGYTDAEVAGMRAADFMHPEDHHLAVDAIETALEEGESFFEARVQAKSGVVRRYEFRGARVDRPDGSLRGIVGIGRDVTERDRMERTARANEERYRTLVEMLPYPVLVHRDGEFLYVNDAMVDLLGVPGPDSLVGTDVVAWVDIAARDDVEETMARTQRGDMQPTEFERTVVTQSGLERYVEATSRSITFEGETAVLTVLQDVTEGHEHHHQLTTLHDLSRQMMAADTHEQIASVATWATPDLLGVDLAAVYGFDEESATLVPHASVDERDESTTTELATEWDAGQLWDVFVNGAPLAWTPTDGDADLGDAIPHGLAIPLGNHGVFVAGDGDPLAAVDRDLVGLLARNLEAALDRAARMDDIRERDRRLAAQNESLERVNRLDGIVRRSTQAIVRATTREEIEENVCDQLASPAPYAFVWLGTRSADGAEITARRWAGIDTEAVDHLTSGGGGSLTALAGRALDTRTVQVQTNVLRDPTWVDYRRDALTHGFRSVAAVPIVRETQTDGVILIHATDDGVFDEEEQAVLAELGRTVGYAIQAVERNAAVATEQRTELDLRVTDDRFFVNRLAAATGAEVEFVGGVPEDGDRFRAFLRFADVDEASVADAVADWESVTAVRRVSETDAGGLYQLQLSMPWLVDLCRTSGATVRAMDVTESGTVLHVVVPNSVDIRSFVETVQGHHPGTELIARRESEVAIDTRETFRDEVRSRFTDRQREALQTAHYAGFYDWPRQCSTAELGAMLDIASSTFQYHLRAAERKLVAAILADDPGARSED